MNSVKPTILFYNFGAKYGGAEIVLLKFLQKPLQDITYQVLLNEYGIFYEKLVENGIPVEVIRTNADQFYSVKRGDSASLKLLGLIPAFIVLFFRVLRYFKRNKFDLIVSNTFKSHIIVGIAARMHRMKAVWRFHDILQQDYTYNQFSPLNIFILRYLSHKIKYVFAVSHAVKDSFEDHGFDTSKLLVIHNGLDVVTGERIKDTGNHTPIRIGWIGQFSPWKGIEEFIGLCRSLIDQEANIQNDFEFIIAGSALFENSEYEAKIRGMVQGSMSNYFTFLGHVTDVDSFYSNIDIYFHTSIAPDPFPTTVLEAGARGLLVFASELGGAGEVITDNKNGYLINMDEKIRLVSRIIKVLNNFSEERIKGEHLRARIKEEFNTDIYCEQFKSELLRVIYPEPS